MLAEKGCVFGLAADQNKTKATVETAVAAKTA